MMSFLGSWHLQRRVFDRLTGDETLFGGTAEVTRTAFRERCTVRHAHGTFDASRSYVLAGHTAGVHVRFPDGRPFIDIALRPRQHVRHLCGDDLYLGHLLFGESEWLEAWKVRGPRKDYFSLARFRRAG
jgi:hypothetical protein